MKRVKEGASRRVSGIKNKSDETQLRERWVECFREVYNRNNSDFKTRNEADALNISVQEKIIKRQL